MVVPAPRAWPASAPRYFRGPHEAGAVHDPASGPGNLRIESQVHRDERSAVVVSGHWRRLWRRSCSALNVLAPGSFYTEPAEQPHCASTGAEPVVVYISGYGPTDTRFEH